MSSRGGGRGGSFSSSRGGASSSRGGGRGGSFSGRGRGGGAPKVRTSGRDAIGIDQILSKNTRYDPRVAKEKQFWEKSKKLRSYGRLLRKEGLANDRTKPGDENDADAMDTSSSSKKKKGGATSTSSSTKKSSSSTPVASSSSSTAAPSSSSSYIPSLSLRAADPTKIFAATPDMFTIVPQGRPKKEKKKRVREDGGGGGSGENENSDSAAASSSSSSSSFPSDHPSSKKQRLTPSELSTLREEKRRAWEARQQHIVESKERRKATTELIKERTDRGQPKLNNQMQLLLEKLQKQTSATSTKK